MYNVKNSFFSKEVEIPQEEKGDLGFNGK